MPKPELTRWGISSPEHFRQQVDREFTSRFPERTVDDLLVHPREAMRFCVMVNETFYTPIDDAIPDDVILRALIAHRKSGKAKKKAGKQG